MKIKISKLFNLVGCVSLLCLAGCADSIDLDPRGTITEEILTSDPQFAETVLNKAYAQIPHGYMGGDVNMRAAATDDAENAYSWSHSNSTFNQSNLTSDNNPYGYYWSNAYFEIRRLNGFIASYDAIPAGEGLLNRFKGEAHFLRGFYYAQLWVNFGGVPIIKVQQSLDDPDLLVSRNTSEETLNFVLEELDMAEGFFANADATASTRGSADAANALKGRLLMYAGRYVESAAASKMVLDNTSRTLDPSYTDIFLNDKSPEVIFDKQFKDPDLSHSQNNWNTAKSTTSISGWGGTNPTQNLVDDYEMQATGLTPAEAGSGFDKMNPYIGRDPRFYASILYDGVMWKGQEYQSRPGGTEGYQNSGDWTKTGYNLRKFIPEDRFDDLPSIQHWVYIRLGEVYLNYAEALIEANTDLDLAVNAINMVRQRSNMPPIAMAGQAELRKKVRHERRIELVFEEHRFWDIRRWKIAGDPEVLNIYRADLDATGKIQGTGKLLWETRVWTDHDYLMPIPQSEIDRNKNLTQNPGY